jgi:hypothetical protein
MVIKKIKLVFATQKQIQADRLSFIPSAALPAQVQWV